MPTPQLKSIAKKAGLSVGAVERLWKKAKAEATKAGRAEDWPYVTGILKRMIKNSKEDKVGKSIVEKTELTKDEKLAVLDARIRRSARWKAGSFMSDPTDGLGIVGGAAVVDDEKLSAASQDIADDIMSDTTYDDNLLDAVRAVKGKLPTYVARVVRNAAKAGVFATEAAIAKVADRVLEREDLTGGQANEEDEGNDD